MRKPFTPVLLAMLFVCCMMVGRASAEDLGKGLQRDLQESKLTVGLAVSKLRDGKDPTEETERLKDIAEKVRASHLLMEERFKVGEEKTATLGALAIGRQSTVTTEYSKSIDDYLALMDAISPDGIVSRETLDALTVLLEKILPKKNRPLLGTLPYQHLNYPAREPVTFSTFVPAYKGGNRTISSADTAASVEAPIPKEIVDQAKTLHWSPVLIYEWVKNNVETEWYRGVMKGAEETLRQKSGNDADQAALLVALLRASGFPARYVTGTIEFFPGIDKVKNLTGIDDPMKIAAFFQKAGIAFKPVISGGGISNFQIEHIWVEAYIPYANYRGAVLDDQGKTWLGLDTSIKTMGFQRNAPFEAPALDMNAIRDDYLQAVQTLPPLEFIKGRAENYLSENHPGKTYQDLLATKTLIPDVLNIRVCSNLSR